jgi:hypothetical protein
LGQIVTRKAINVAHGKAKKVFTMDVASNQAFAEVWNLETVAQFV